VIAITVLQHCIDNHCGPLNQSGRSDK